jgi:WD40 repeat protein
MRTVLVITALALAAASPQAAEPSGTGRAGPAQPAPPPSAGAGAAAPVGAPAAGSPLPPGAVRRFGGDRFRVAGEPRASALSPDATRLAVLSSAQGRHRVLLNVFDAVTGRPLCRASVESAGSFVTPRLAFSPDGNYVAAVVSPAVRVVWAAATGELVTKLPPSEAGYSLCQFTPEGLLAVTERGRTDLYQIPSGKVAKRWPAGQVARLTADARTFVRVDREFAAVSLGDPATGAVAGTLAVKAADNGLDNGLAFSPDGKKLAVVHDRERIQIWDTATRKQVAEAMIPPSAIAGNDPHYAVSFSPDGRTVVLETKRGEIHRWDTRSLTPLPALKAARATYIRGVCWSGDGRTILAAASNGLVHRWDAKTGKRSPDDGYNGPPRFALTPNGSHLVVGDRAGRIDVWDLATGRVVRQLHQGRDEGHALVCLPVSPDGRRVAAGEGHCEVRVFRTDGGGDALRLSCLFRLDGGWMTFLAWAPDGKSVFADGSGMILCRVNLADGKTVWARGDEDVRAYGLTPDGRFVVKALRDGIQFLDASTGKESSTVRLALTPQQAEEWLPLRAVAFAPDGKQFALAVGSRTVAVCDRAGRELRRFAAAGRKRWPGLMPWELVRLTPEEHYHRVEALAFTPDGKWIVSGAEDLSVRVWEAATGKPVVRFDGPDSAAEQVAVAPDGRSAFSAGGGGFVWQWDLTPRPYPRPGQRPDDLWAAAGEPDPASAVPAAWALVTRSEAARAFVAGKLPPQAPALPEDVAKWLADLDSAVFAEREAATEALAAQGRTVEGRLREVVQTATSAEVRRRARDLLARLQDRYTADELRALRLVQACEVSGTAAARALLRRWAGGAPGAVLTEDAKAALARLGRRPR